MYVTFREGPLPSILCPEAVQWVLEVLKVPMNLTNWVLVGSGSPNLAVQLHIRLKSEISVVFGHRRELGQALSQTGGTLHQLLIKDHSLSQGLQNLDGLHLVQWYYTLVKPNWLAFHSKPQQPKNCQCIGLQPLLRPCKNPGQGTLFIRAMSADR